VAERSIGLVEFPDWVKTAVMVVLLLCVDGKHVGPSNNSLFIHDADVFVDQQGSFMEFSR